MPRSTLARALPDDVVAPFVAEDAAAPILTEEQPSEAIRAFVVRALYEVGRRRLRDRQPAASGLVLPAGASADPEAQEAMAGLVRVIGRLSADDRHLFVLRQVQGLAQVEISAATRLSIGTVRRRLWRLQRQIASLVRDEPSLATYADQSVLWDSVLGDPAAGS
jgi:RNA polymerase sigma factor (sigma-70 family)